MEIYVYRMSRRAVALRIVLWVVVLYGWLVGLYLYGVPTDAPLMKWGTGGVTAVSAILLCVAVWNWLHPATYEVRITREQFSIHYPGQPALSFEVPVAEISHLENCFQRTHAGEQHLGHFVVLRSGERHRITTNYFTSIRKLHQALQSVAPGIGYETVRTQSVA